MWTLRRLTSFWCVSLHVDQIWLFVEARNGPEIKFKDRDEIIRKAMLKGALEDHAAEGRVK